MPESLGQPTIKPREHHHYLNKLAEDLVCNTCILEQCSTIIAHLLMPIESLVCLTLCMYMLTFFKVLQKLYGNLINRAGLKTQLLNSRHKNHRT